MVVGSEGGKEMKEFLDDLRLASAKRSSLKTALKEVEQYLTKPQHQEIIIGNILTLMGLRNIGVEDLSDAAGKHRSYVGRLLRNDFPRFNPSVETLRAIAQALQVKPSTLVLVDLKTEFQKMLKSLEKD